MYKGRNPNWARVPSRRAGADALGTVPLAVLLRRLASIRPLRRAVAAAVAVWLLYVVALALLHALRGGSAALQTGQAVSWPAVDAGVGLFSTADDSVEAVWEHTPVFVRDGAMQLNVQWVNAYLVMLGRQLGRPETPQAAGAVAGADTLATFSYAGTPRGGPKLTSWRCGGGGAPEFCHLENAYLAAGRLYLYIDETVDLARLVALQQALRTTYGLPVQIATTPPAGVESAEALGGWTYGWGRLELPRPEAEPQAESLLDEVLELSSVLYTLKHVQEAHAAPSETRVSGEHGDQDTLPALDGIVEFGHWTRGGGRRVAQLRPLLCARWAASLGVSDEAACGQKWILPGPAAESPDGAAGDAVDGDGGLLGHLPSLWRNAGASSHENDPASRIRRFEHLVVGAHPLFSVSAQRAFFARSISDEVLAVGAHADRSAHAMWGRRTAQWVSTLVRLGLADPTASANPGNTPSVCLGADLSPQGTLLNAQATAAALKARLVGHAQARMTLGALARQLRPCRIVAGAGKDTDAPMLFLLGIADGTDHGLLELQPLSAVHLANVGLRYIAQWLGVRYATWGVQRLEDVRFVPSPASQARLASHHGPLNPLSELFPVPRRGGAAAERTLRAAVSAGLPFREQFAVDLPSLESVMGVLTAGLTGYPERAKFLVHMPWEQVNNQLIELKSACAVARELNRTLVLPPIGQRLPGNTQWDFTFDVTAFAWAPLQRYFDTNAALARLPCRAVTMENFQRLARPESWGGAARVGPPCKDVGLDVLHHNPFGAATRPQQLPDYYAGKLGLCVGSRPVQDDGRQYQLNGSAVRALYGSDAAPVLALGAMFWYHGFGRWQPYPLQEYVDYLDEPVYAAISAALVPTPLTRYVARFALLDVLSPWLRVAWPPAGGRRAAARPPRRRFFFALHVRRGDYWAKCSKIRDVKLQERCFPRIATITARLHAAHQRAKQQLPASEFAHAAKPLVYIATNLDADRREFAPLRKHYHLVFFDDVFGSLLRPGASMREAPAPSIAALGDDANDVAAVDDPATAHERQQRAQYRYWLASVLALAQLDSVEKAFLDVELCAHASVQHFIGNIYSSFSRTILERRALSRVRGPFGFSSSTF